MTKREEFQIFTASIIVTTFYLREVDTILIQRERMSIAERVLIDSKLPDGVAMIWRDWQGHLQDSGGSI